MASTLKALRRGIVPALVLGAAFGLSGCKIFVKEEPPPCPRVSILADASSLTDFRPGPGRDITDVDLQAKIVNYQGSCFYKKDDKTMTMSLQVGIDVQRGPALTEGHRQLSYFIAVPNFFPFDGAKKVLPVTVDFPKNVDMLHLTDRDVEVTFPIRSTKELERYELFIGLQLTEDQLHYNRQHVSL